MKTVLQFLENLNQNNNRDWFQYHKAEFLQAQSRFQELATEVLQQMQEFDEDLQGLTIKDCTYRIYRDVRFSADKRPYKTHFGCVMSKGGRKSGYMGYYFQVGVEEEWPNLVAVGHYQCLPQVVQVVREDIENGGEDFKHIINQVDSRLKLDDSIALKRVPKGFLPDSPNADYLRLKNYCLVYSLPHDQLFTPYWQQELLTMFKSAKPFVDYINRAIEYVQEEQRDYSF